MDPRNPLECPCAPETLLGFVPFSGDQPLGFWESAGGLWNVPAFWGHPCLGWDWNVFRNPKGINQMCFPEAAGCLCPSGVTAALPTAFHCNPAQRCACSRKTGIYSRVPVWDSYPDGYEGGVVWRNGDSNPRVSGRSSNHREVRVERSRARRQTVERGGRGDRAALPARSAASPSAPPCGLARRRRRFPWRWKMAPRGESGTGG